ncbi:hypothetical protein PRIPAC_91533, partial [Pristionchus pacificus]|uniref:Uncharacterized protein n=1 Tax=Pristionchus pacificus TaxID=54126 RepID=A0A2A6BPL9_PRIPA
MFVPMLTNCPHEANFFCAPESDASLATTMIAINGGEVIARGLNGTNCVAALTCNGMKLWQTGSGTIVQSIIC